MADYPVRDKDGAVITQNPHDPAWSLPTPHNYAKDYPVRDGNGDVLIDYANGSDHRFANAEARTLIARFDAQPDNARKQLIDTLVGSLKGAGVWAKLDVLYIMAAHDEQAARRNWISNKYNITPVADPVFTADRGYTGDAVAASLNTGINPIELTKYTRNSASYGTWCRLPITDSGQPVIRGSSTILMYPRIGAGTVSYRINDGVSSAIAVPTPVGLTVANRAGATDKELYKNGVLIGEDTTASAAVATGNVEILSGTTQFSANQVAMACMGGSLSAAEQLALYTATRTYLQAVGAA